MKNLLKELIEENVNILHTYPSIEDNLRTSAGHRYMFNKEIISKLKLLIITDVSQQRELFYNFITWYNAKTNKSKDKMIYTDTIEEYLKL